MYRKELPHIVLTEVPETKNYTTPQKFGGEPRVPCRNRKIHGEAIKSKLQKAWEIAALTSQERTTVSLPVANGIYLEFRSALDYDLITKSLENLTQHIRLLNIHTCMENGQKITKATVFIPKEKFCTFIKKVEDYLNKDTRYGQPVNAKLVNSIEDIKIAVLESFWCDDLSLMPQNNQIKWCEVWLRSNDESEQEQNFYELCSTLDIEYRKNEILEFPERKVFLIKADTERLTELICSSPYIAEFRLAKETANFWVGLNNKEQSEWVENLSSRLVVNKTSQVSVCVLDTGVNNGHDLLGPIINDNECFTVENEWGKDDKDGHGTLMCGVVCYGDLQNCLESSRNIEINHNIESVKLLPASGKTNEEHLYGSLTEQGVYYVETDFPDRERSLCLAVTADACSNGKPSSWSGALDKLSSGMEDNNRRLIIVSAGNILDNEEWKSYPDSNLTNTVQEPAQSWNALTIGAFTRKHIITDDKFSGYEVLAKDGELSPYSRTSLNWDKKWPIKPDVVFEGGNLAKDSDNFVGDLNDLSLLSLSSQTTKRQFDLINATSAATAQASWFATQLRLKYSDLWPETIRALMIHSAEWTESLINQFKFEGTQKENCANLLRICGYGVPDLGRALYSAGNSLTLISENYLQPYNKENGTYKTKDMHLIELPWPKEVLQDLPSDTNIKLKITLSYFIEPGPGEIGWKDRYRYQSHALRFSLMMPSDTKDKFIKRINQQAREEEENVDSITDYRWKLGPNNRNLGSIHSDTWEGSAAEISSCSFVGIYPVIGWWRERHHLGSWDKQTRYSLIVSLETPNTEIDLYTPVEIKLKTPIEIST